MSDGDSPDEPHDDLPDEPHDPPEIRREADESIPALEQGDGGGPSSSREGPLGELVDEVGRRRDERGDEYDDLFVSEDVGDLDSDLVWEELETGGVSVEEKLRMDEHVVKTSSYCETCEYFSEPPEVACGHDGTDIVDMVDIEHFTVRNCPKVAEDIAVGEFDPAAE